MKVIERKDTVFVKAAGTGQAVGSGISATAAAVGVAAATTGIGAAIGTAAAIGAAVSAVSNNADGANSANSNSANCSATDAMGNATGVSCDGADAGGGGGGGKVICTELCRNGAIEHEVWMADIRYSRENFSEQTMRGYHLWGVPYVKLMRKYPSFAKLAEYPTRWFAEDIAYRMGVRSNPNYKGWVLREVFFRPVCFGIGLFAKARDWQALWRDGVTPAGVRS